MDVFPVKVLREILEFLRPPIISPMVAEDAVWIRNTKYIPNWWSQKSPNVPENTFLINNSRAWNNTYTPNKLKGRGTINILNSSGIVEIKDTTLHYRKVLPMRLVNRLFNEILASFVYREFNIFDIEDERDEEVAALYGKHVTVLRGSIDIKRAGPYDYRIAKVLSLCDNVRSLALYYWGERRDAPFYTPTSLTTAILSSIRDRQLRSIGFYSTTTNWPDGNTSLGNSDFNLLEEIASSDQARFIKHLDLYFSFLPNKTFNFIPGRFTGLQTLTMRDMSWPLAPPVWVDTNPRYWGHYSNLLTLKLGGCANLPPAGVPDLVRHFHSLENLVLSGCHNNYEPVAHKRTLGWSSMPDGWWSHRKPLKFMHIEELYDAEVLAMGTIPVTQLTAVKLMYTDFTQVFNQDMEIFPHLKVLRLEPSFDSTISIYGEFDLEKSVAVQDALRKWKMRGIEIERDAVALI
ncbi:hypothetical protein CPB86DRAFT_793275 [Serendipita vermifera]|nr:hypothetical protein CPB86DRAFT_793275 [Serendipita vermifera]